MESNPVIHFVGLHCPPDQEVKFNKWYNEKHVPDLLKVKGVRRVARYQIVTPGRRYPGFPDTKYPNYLAIWEFDNQEAFEAYEASPELTEGRKDASTVQPELGYERMWRVEYKALQTWER